jgi:hypothetical protein
MVNCQAKAQVLDAKLAINGELVTASSGRYCRKGRDGNDCIGTIFIRKNHAFEFS